MKKIIAEEGKDEGKSLSIISGATYGSCFIGMVHLLKQNYSSNETKVEITEDILQKVKLGKWLANESGNFGIDADFENSIRESLNTRKVTAHLNIITLGAIPVITSNEVQVSISRLTDFNSEAAIGRLKSQQGDKKTLATSVKSAESEAKLQNIKNSTRSNILSNLQKIDEEKNNIFDLNSMMTAFEDYVNKAQRSEKFGIPINYYVKDISRSQIARLWTEKYFVSQDSE